MLYFSTSCFPFSTFILQAAELWVRYLHSAFLYDISGFSELCSADGLGIAVRKQRETLGREKLPLSTWRPAAGVTSTAEAISSELSKCVKNIILLIEQSSFCEGDLIQLRLDWLYSVVVRYVAYIPSWETVLNLLHQAVALLVTNSDKVDCRHSSVSSRAEILHFGQRGRPRFFISKDKLEFLLDMKFTSGEIASIL